MHFVAMCYIRYFPADSKIKSSYMAEAGTDLRYHYLVYAVDILKFTENGSQGWPTACHVTVQHGSFYP